MADKPKKKVKKEVTQRVGRGPNPDATMTAVRDVNASDVVDIAEYKKKADAMKGALNTESERNDTVSEPRVDPRKKMPAGLRGAVLYVSHKFRRNSDDLSADIVEYRYGISERSGYELHTTAATAEEFSVDQQKVILLDREVSKLYAPSQVNTAAADDITVVLSHMHNLQTNNPQRVALLYRQAVEQTVEDMRRQGRGSDAEALAYRHPPGEDTEAAATLYETASKFSLSVNEMLGLEKQVGRKLLEMLLNEENNEGGTA